MDSLSSNLLLSHLPPPFLWTFSPVTSYWVIRCQYFRGLSPQQPLTGASSASIFVDFLSNNRSPGHPVPVFSWTFSPVTAHRVIRCQYFRAPFPTQVQIRSSLPSPPCYFPNKIPHTGACFAWPGGVREGRAAFATVSALPSQRFSQFTN